jgi:hypothetical protein
MIIKNGQEPIKDDCILDRFAFSALLCRRQQPRRKHRSDKLSICHFLNSIRSLCVIERAAPVVPRAGLSDPNHRIK